MAMIALSLLSSAAADGLVVRSSLLSGKINWAKRPPTDRVEQPSRYWSWVALQALAIGVKTLGGATLAYVVLELVRSTI
jgi:hypothetical protein